MEGFRETKFGASVSGWMVSWRVGQAGVRAGGVGGAAFK